jgi:hypothetical protein
MHILKNSTSEVPHTNFYESFQWTGNLSTVEWNDKRNKIILTSFLYKHYLYTLYYSLQPTNHSLYFNRNRKLLQNKIILHRPIQAIHAYTDILTHINFNIGPIK